MPGAGGVTDIYTVIRDVFSVQAQCVAFKRRFDGYQGREALSPQILRSIKPFGGISCIFAFLYEEDVEHAGERALIANP